MFKRFFRNDGFSLVELLVYIAILGTILGIAVSILTTVTRTQIVNAASFDSNLLPNIDNQYAVGSDSGPQRWKSASFSQGVNMATVSGNVGIGTASPSQKLDVNGIVNVSGVVKSTGLYIGSDAGTYILDTLSSTGTNRSVARFGVSGYSNGFTVNYTDSPQSMTYSFIDGNLGIGTTTPDYKLKIVSTNTANVKESLLSIESSVVGNNSIRIKNNSAGGKEYILAATGASHVYGSGGFMIFDNSSSSPNILIDTSGNVGIGMVTPLRGTLDVSGRNSYIGTNAIAMGYANVEPDTGDRPSIGYNFVSQANGTWKYQKTDNAYMMNFSEGYIYFYTAMSGTAGNLIDWGVPPLAIRNTGYVGIGTGTSTNPTSMLTVVGPISLKAPPTPKTAATYSMVATDSSLIFKSSATVTLTLQNAAAYPGRMLYVKTITAYAVNSSASNVKPLTSDTAGTAIVAATAGRWALLQSDGTNWVIMAANP
jgi:prepilin-type N-terminal cleavage/methylation domain-containing protein